ncbi:MAG: patatin-like phospholipase family protein [Acidimicrobiia bacterium]|nr:patatin-like phospholipase family protein [Actinomycetota bacterium]MBL6924885.1 patatin-like phospholipase family protein [Acidimicrobiia bacterium]
MALRGFLRRFGRQAPQPNTVFVLSGGAVRGAAQVGMIRSLFEQGIFPDQVVGVSAGALNGISIAHSPTLEQVGDLEEVWRSLVDKSPMKSNIVRTVASIMRGRPSFDSGQKLRQIIEEQVPVADIGDTTIPFHAGTTAASTGRLCWWRHGPAVDILCASTAIPGVFPAVELPDGDMHLDGGIVSNIPLRYAVSLRPTRMVVLDVASRFLPPGKQTALSLMLTGFRAAAAELTRQQWQDVPSGLDVLHIEMPPEDPDVDYDFDDAHHLIVQGGEAADRVLEGL